MSFSPMRCNAQRLVILDQTKLPLAESYVECANIRMVWDALKKLKVRGAPLIGAFASYGVYIGVKDFNGKDREAFVHHAQKIIDYLRTSRPTAVNLFWALDRMLQFIVTHQHLSVAQLKNKILQEAHRVQKEEIRRCRLIGSYGLSVVKSGDRILTHCNAGMLATSGEGTALAVIYAAQRKYKNLSVYADETRPLLQGARLTCWELIKNGIKPTLICDNMAAVLMKKKRIDKVIVGADRIAANGDTANKIGTYSVAVLCKQHGIPFYIAAPVNTFDHRIAVGEAIPIEERDPEEVKTCFGKKIAPDEVAVYNPAFDVTPAELITAIITDVGVLYPPYSKSIVESI